MKKQNFDPNNWDWYKYLEAKEKVKRIYYKKALDKASNWITCACGQLLCNSIKKDLQGRPSDYKLRMLGALFYSNIGIKNFEKAKKKYISLGLEFTIQDHHYYHSIYTKDPDEHTVELTTLVVDEKTFYK